MNFLVKEFCCAVHLNKLRMSAPGTKQSFGFKTYSLTLPNLSGRILLVMVE